MMAHNRACTTIGEDNGTKACQLYYLEIHQQKRHDVCRNIVAEGAGGDAATVQESRRHSAGGDPGLEPGRKLHPWYLWEYRDEKAFVACQELFREAEAKMDERTDIAKIITPSRGIILRDIRL